AGAQQTDELARFHRQVDVVEQFADPALGQRYDLFQVAGFQAEALAAIEDIHHTAGNAEQERADAHALLVPDEHRFGDAPAADQHPVDAVQIAEAEPFRQPFQDRVPAGGRRGARATGANPRPAPD